MCKWVSNKVVRDLCGLVCRVKDSVAAVCVRLGYSGGVGGLHRLASEIDRQTDRQTHTYTHSQTHTYTHSLNKYTSVINTLAISALGF